jgi:hypothetical protein
VILAFFFLLAGVGVEGQGSGKKRPKSKPSPRIKAATMVNSPRAKQLIMRGRERPVALRRAIWVGGKSSRLLTGKFASAWPPTLSTHTVATAMANHKRSARTGSIILV